MSSPSELPPLRLQFYVTTPYPCGYLPDKQAQSLIAAPHQLIDTQIYNSLIEQGFRRSGKYAYRPHCEHCKACIPVRVMLDKFKANRSQRRAFKAHADLTSNILPLDFRRSHFELYRNYQQLRHPDVESANQQQVLDEEEQYRQFLCQSHVDSVMVEFRDTNHQVKIVSVVDVVNDGLSAVYTFYDANDTQASYGTYSILWLIEWAKRQGLPYLYLGYWIEASQKMAYKQHFRPQQRLDADVWVPCN